MLSPMEAGFSRGRSPYKAGGALSRISNEKQLRFEQNLLSKEVENSNDGEQESLQENIVENENQGKSNSTNPFALISESPMQLSSSSTSKSSKNKEFSNTETLESVSSRELSGNKNTSMPLPGNDVMTQVGFQSDMEPLNISDAFSYFRSLPATVGLENDLELVNKFNFDGALNSIRDILHAADEESDSISDVLDSWICNQQTNCYDNNKFEKFFNYDNLDFNTSNQSASPLSENYISSRDLTGNIGSTHLSERRDSRSSAFVGTSFVWRSPGADSSSKDVRPFVDLKTKNLSFIDKSIDKKSEEFKKFQILPKTRDSILITLSETHHAQFWGDSANVNLPSFEELTLFVISYFKLFHARYQIIHLPSFDPNKVSNVLLISILGAGAFFYGIENDALKRIGRYFFEISRRRLILEFEENNTNIRNLELHQANLINYIAGSWSGIDRNVEVSESFTSTIATMVRRGDLFKRYQYKTLQEIIEDPELASTEQKWKTWIQMESKKLLVYVMFYWCSQFSLITNIPYFINYIELELPLPHMEPLWRSSDANEWLRLVNIIKNQSPQHYSNNMSFQLLIGSILSSRQLPSQSLSPKFISDVIIGNLIATIKHFISGHNDRLAFTNHIPGIADIKKRKRHSLSLDATFHLSYLVNRKAEIENMLESMESLVSNQGLANQVLYKLEIEYSYICLYASIKDCMKLAGVDDEIESRQVIPRLLQWYKKDSSRIAIWHCAQILKLAKTATANHICKYFYYLGSLMIKTNKKQSFRTYHF
ncbi:uncharacterized protein PRCAT00005099001 [Priceomyces carsonii]|uniref:uncharacterized protein n=1 Tax=Priceomyces carsonii TaxID=28549 RepID=UPI002EDB0B1E|nr:unnamed protein product [Priceomyces carsonii]